MPLECSKSTTAAVAFGSNEGDSAAIIKGAIAALAEHSSLTVLTQSRLYQTAPIGPPQPDYLNGCLLLRSYLSALDLMECLLQVEQQFGRRRTIHWGPRTLDLDLIYFGHQIINHAHLVLPHPRMHERAFVLLPLNELCPDWVHPKFDQSIQLLLSKLDMTGIKPWQKIDI